MRKTLVVIVLTGLMTTVLAPTARAKPTCDQVLAAMEKAGGSLSADEVAKKLDTTPGHVRECMAQTKGGAAPAPAAGTGAATGK